MFHGKRVVWVTSYVKFLASGLRKGIAMDIGVLCYGPISGTLSSQYRMGYVESTTLWLVEGQETDNEDQEADHGLELERGLPAEVVNHIEVVGL